MAHKRQFLESSLPQSCTLGEPETVGKKAVETRFIHWESGSKRALGNNGGVVDVECLPRYENNEKLCKTSAAQVNPLDKTLTKEYVAVSVNQSEGITPHDLPIFDAGHACCS